MEIAEAIDASRIEALAAELDSLRARKGTLWIVGLGWSAANASHAASDFQRLCHINARSVTDNTAFFTAAANDEGWSSALSLPNPQYGDAILVFSVGGGTEDVSTPITMLLRNSQGLALFGIVGRDGGETARRSQCCIIIPNLYPERVTPHTEAFHLVILHCLVSHPILQRKATKW